LGDDAEQLVTWIGNAAFMRLERVNGADGADADDTGAGRRKCIALSIDASSGSFACSIYETRPQVCRDLERGGSACRGELAVKSDRPKRALAVLRRVPIS
jgi:Fe-S-cluster containining protein